MQINISMLQKLDLKVSKNLIDLALKSLPSEDFRYTINQPMNRYFYDPWEIKPEFKGTVWEDVLATLPFAIGEARIAILKYGSAYQIHADIDDRYHLNLQEESSYLIDLENEKMHKLMTDGFWYLMDAGRLHTATNFGRCARVQIVVRKLLDERLLHDPVSIILSSSGYSKDDARFLFDNTLSTWLNRANKRGLIDDFKFSTNKVTFRLEKSAIDDLKSRLISGFTMEIL